MDYSALSDIPAQLPPGPSLLSLRRLFFGNGLARLVADQNMALRSLDALEAKTKRSFSMGNVEANAGDFGSGYGYEDDLREVVVALAYKKEIDGRFADGGDSPGLYVHHEQILSSVVESLPSSVINFGVSYAYMDALLARKYPGTRFVGVDRSVLTKALNEREFSGIPNLECVASDIFAFLAKGHEGAVLWHTRTALLLPKPFMLKLYEAAATAGIRTICAFEPVGLSRETMQPYHFSDSDQPSVALREGMFIHNYPGLLKSAGYAVERAELKYFGHQHPDIRYVTVTAHRNG